jgi:hypothetical protein
MAFHFENGIPSAPKVQKARKMSLQSMKDRFPGAWRGFRSDKIPLGESIWDVAPDSWDIDCSGCATPCVEKYDGECVFTPPDTPQIMIRFFCEQFPEYRPPECILPCEEKICPYWLVRGSIGKFARSSFPVVEMKWGETTIFYRFMRRRPK